MPFPADVTGRTYHETEYEYVTLATGGVPDDSNARYGGLMTLADISAGQRLEGILEHVLGRLGPGVELSLEIRARNDAGYDDATQRIVSENASNLGAGAAEFE